MHRDNDAQVKHKTNIIKEGIIKDSIKFTTDHPRL